MRFLSLRLQVQHNFYFFHLTVKSTFSEHFKNILLNYVYIDEIQQMNAYCEQARDSKKYKQNIILALKESRA